MKYLAKNRVILKRLNNIPAHSKILQISTPFAWLIYIEFSPSQYYYIAVEKK